MLVDAWCVRGCALVYVVYISSCVKWNVLNIENVCERLYMCALVVVCGCVWCVF